MSQHILFLLVENEPGTLSRIAGLFSARGYNIDSLSVAPTQDPTLSQMTIVTRGDSNTIEQITKHANKLIEVLKITDITEKAHLAHEMMMVKVSIRNSGHRQEIKQLGDIFRCNVVSVADKSYIFQIVGAREKLSAFLHAIGHEHIVDISRTGVCGIVR